MCTRSIVSLQKCQPHISARSRVCRAVLCWQLLTQCSSISQTLLWLLKIAGGLPPFEVSLDGAGLGRIGCGLFVYVRGFGSGSLSVLASCAVALLSGSAWALRVAEDPYQMVERRSCRVAPPVHEQTKAAASSPAPKLKDKVYGGVRGGVKTQKCTEPPVKRKKGRKHSPPFVELLKERRGRGGSCCACTGHLRCPLYRNTKSGTGGGM